MSHTSLTGPAPGKGRRIVCVVEALTTGGAQRQLYYLATGLKQRGAQVSLLTYHLVDYNHREYFRESFEQSGIEVTTIAVAKPWRQFLALRQALRRSRPDVVIAFLWRPSLLVELASLPRRDFALVVSERTGNPGSLALTDHLRLQGHRLADAVVVNSAHLEGFFRITTPWLSPKLHRITNCVDLERFRPAAAPAPAPGPLRIVVIARFRPEKNFAGLLAAIELLRRGKPSVDVVVDWYGNDFFIGDLPSERSRPFLQLKDDVRMRGLGACFRLHRPVADVVPLYQQADAFCLPSLYESFPNVICEALACGRPVLASAISDNHRLVRHGENGFLFDPASPESIADAIRRFAALSATARAAMGQASRRVAEELLAPQTMRERWSGLIDHVVATRGGAR